MAAALLGRLFPSLLRPRYCLGATCSMDKWSSKCISSDNRPKKPLTSYLRFFVDQQPIYKKQNPDLSILDITKKIAYAWKQLPASSKQPYETAVKVEREVYQEQLAKYKAQLTPEQEAILKEEKQKRRQRKRVTRKKRQLTLLGKPKRYRNAFNIFMAEHFQEAKGASPQEKMKTLFDEWSEMTSSQKQTYQQFAEDDKIRYQNEMKSWEEHMNEIGHGDLLRYKSQKQIPNGKETKKKTSKKRIVILNKTSDGKIVSRAKNKQKLKAEKLEE